MFINTSCFMGFLLKSCACIESFWQSMEPVKVEELKTEKCCRISAEDLIEMGELCGPSSSKSPTKRKPNSRPMIIVIDIRNPEEYPYKAVSDWAITPWTDLWREFICNLDKASPLLFVCLLQAVFLQRRQRRNLYLLIWKVWNEMKWNGYEPWSYGEGYIVQKS